MNEKNIKEKMILYLFKCLMTAFIGLFVYFVWILNYNSEIPLEFFRYGNYLLAISFTVLYVIFVRVYGGFMVGTASVIDLIFSQIISLGFLEAAKYVIFSLLSYKLLLPWPFIVNYIFCKIWNYIRPYAIS